MIKIGTVCTGIGSPEEAVQRMKIPHEIVFGCEIDGFARKSYLQNFKPNAFYNDMTAESWEGGHYYADLFIGGIPCQSFSLAGKRLGELDKRGLLFFDFYRYVKNQQPKCFIIENVKGLLSDKKGRTFQNWKDLLGRSENGQEYLFQHPDSLGYNLFWQVLNTKDYDLPQNRERVFLVGIRNDLPMNFVFPSKRKLLKRLKDVLEPIVDEKYFLSEKMIAGFKRHAERHAERGNGFKFEPKDPNGIANTITTTEGSRGYNNFIANTINAGVGKMRIEDNYIIDIEKIGYINQDTQASQVYGNGGVFPTITAGSQGYANGYVEHPPELIQVGELDGDYESEGRVYDVKGISRTIKNGGGGASKTGYYLIDEPKILGYTRDSKGKVTARHEKDIAGTLHTSTGSGGNTDQFVQYGYRIRRLTPLECFRLQGYTDQFFYNCQKVNSDTQLYKQAGNTISVTVMESILKNLLKILT